MTSGEAENRVEEATNYQATNHTHSWRQVIASVLLWYCMLRMPFTSNTTSHNKNNRNNEDELRSLWSATLEIFIHSILFTRHLYPKDTFAPTRFLGIQCRVNRHQDVVSYISEAVKVIVPALFRGTASAIVLDLFEHGKSSKREVYFLDFKQKLGPVNGGASNLQSWEKDFQNLVLSAYSLDRESPGWKSSATFKVRLLIDDENKSCTELDSALQNGEWFCPRTDHASIRRNKSPTHAYDMTQCRASFLYFREE